MSLTSLSPSLSWRSRFYFVFQSQRTCRVNSDLPLKVWFFFPLFLFSPTPQRTKCDLLIDHTVWILFGVHLYMWQHVCSSDMLCSSWNVRGDFYSMMYFQGSCSPAQGAASGACHSPVLPNPDGPEASPVSPLLMAADEEIIMQGWKGNPELSGGNTFTRVRTHWMHWI